MLRSIYWDIKEGLLHRLFVFLVLMAAIFFCAGCRSISSSESHDLEQTLRIAIESFQGEVGVYVRKLDGGCEVAIGADELYPTASLIKVPIVMALLDKVEVGQLDWNRPIVYRTSQRSTVGEDLMAKFKDGSEISLDKLIFLTQSVSDNTAARLAQDLAGGGAAINRWLASNQWLHTRVNARVDGRSPFYDQYGWGQTTPREMAEMFIALRQRRAISPHADEYLDRMLGKAYWDDEALSAIPSDVHVISKQGAINASRSEVLLVSAPSGPYVLCVITRNQTDQSWGDDNEGFQLLRQLSRLVWNALEPGRPYESSLEGPVWPKPRESISK